MWRLFQSADETFRRCLWSFRKVPREHGCSSRSEMLLILGEVAALGRGNAWAAHWHLGLVLVSPAWGPWGVLGLRPQSRACSCRCVHLPSRIVERPKPFWATGPISSLQHNLRPGQGYWIRPAQKRAPEGRDSQYRRIGSEPGVDYIML